MPFVWVEYCLTWDQLNTQSTRHLIRETCLSKRCIGVITSGCLLLFSTKSDSLPTTRFPTCQTDVATLNLRLYPSRDVSTRSSWMNLDCPPASSHPFGRWSKDVPLIYENKRLFCERECCKVWLFRQLHDHPSEFPVVL